MTTLNKLEKLVEDDELMQNLRTGVKLLIASFVSSVFTIPLNIAFYLIATLAAATGQGVIIALTALLGIPVYIIGMIVIMGISVRWLYDWE